MRNHPTIFGTHDANTIEQLEDAATRAERIALMADGHLGYFLPVGGVAAYAGRVNVAGVGFDIGCGNAAIRTGTRMDAIYEERSDIADAISDSLSFGLGRSNRSDDAPTDHPLFEHAWWDSVPGTDVERERFKRGARMQLGTIGSGNHYVDVFEDEDGFVWIGVHFGSRGFGWKHAMGTMALAQGAPYHSKVRESEAILDLDTPLGDFYWTGMEIAGEYAKVGREWAAYKTAALLSAEPNLLIHNHHNFAWKELQAMPDGLREMIVVRKGATPAWPGQTGFVGGSMGDDAVIVQGALAASVETELLQESAMYSTVHGAGRVMSRTKAKGKYNRRTGEVKTPGLITPQMQYGWLKKKDVVLRGGGVDEAPQAYRRLPDVLAAQGDTINVLHTLKPHIVVMAGADEFDPFKD